MAGWFCIELVGFFIFFDEFNQPDEENNRLSLFIHIWAAGFLLSLTGAASE